jgi:hypothetical protein
MAMSQYRETVMAKALPSAGITRRTLADVQASAPPAAVTPPAGSVSMPAKTAPAARPVDDDRLSVMLPAGVVRAVKQRALSEDLTVRAVVLRALRADGFEVADDEIVDRRVEANRRRGR